MNTGIFFIIGLIIGSFLNVVVYRLRTAETILGRSYCPKCKRLIAWRDNIPVLSFILLRGRCRSCQEKISWQYPILELLTAIVFALTYYFFSPGNQFDWIILFFYLFLFSGLLVLAVYDARYLEIPMSAFWVLTATVFVFSLILFYRDISAGIAWQNSELIVGLIGGFLAWFLFFGLVFFSREKWMGWGDVYVAVVSGFLLGWRYLYLGLLLSFAFGAFYAILVMFWKKKKMRTQVPFIPFLVAGTILTIFLRQINPEIIKPLIF